MRVWSRGWRWRRGAGSGCAKDSRKSKVEAEAGSSAAIGVPVSPLSFVPARIASQLGASNVVMAIDLARISGLLDRFRDLMVDQLSCARELLPGMELLVLGADEDASQVFITQLPEAATRKCLDAIAPLFGARTHTSKHHYELEASGKRYAMTWQGGVVAIRPAGQAVQAGALSAEVRAQIEKVPASAVGWLASGGFDKYKIDNAIAWIELEPDTVRLRVIARGTEAGVAEPWVRGIVEGFQEGAAAKGIAIEERWFTLTSQPMSAELDARIPKFVFEGANDEDGE
ncbi:MAG: hypothetical protein ACTHU0_35340 [Kofleriaceae bacterium]